MNTNKQTPVLTFASRQDFRSWLEGHAQTSQGFWMGLSKSKAIASVSAAEALEEALCFGWIDGQMKTVDEQAYHKYFSPRRPTGRWSDKNKGLVEVLRAAGRMTPLGEAAVSLAQANGTWDSPGPGFDFEALGREWDLLLAPFAVAAEKYRLLAPSRRKQMLGFYFDAKQEDTRKKRLLKIVDFLENDRQGMLF